MVARKPLWSVPRLWEGERAYIIGGGPSVLSQDLSLLRGRRVIVINRSFETFLDAEFLYFHDWRFWGQYFERLKAFRNTIVTTSRTMRNLSFIDARVRCLEKVKPPPGISTSSMKLVVRHTSLTGAINLARHLGCDSMVLLGADLKRDQSGRTHHHHPHPWPVRDGCYDLMMEDLKLTAAALKQEGLPVINTSLDSAFDAWPKMPLEQVL